MKQLHQPEKEVKENYSDTNINYVQLYTNKQAFVYAEMQGFKRKEKQTFYVR